MSTIWTKSSMEQQRSFLVWQRGRAPKHVTTPPCTEWCHLWVQTIIAERVEETRKLPYKPNSLPSRSQQYSSSHLLPFSCFPAKLCILQPLTCWSLLLHWWPHSYWWHADSFLLSSDCNTFFILNFLQINSLDRGVLSHLFTYVH